jgi:hypothetical protein
MKKLLLVSSLVLFLVSCKEISGTVDVQQSFKAIVNNKCSWNPFKKCDPTKTVEIPAGHYNAKVDFGSKKEIKIEMKANAYKETIILNRPKNFEFPQNGSFLLSSSQVGQEFGVSGQVTTQVWDSQSYRDNESCTYTVRDWVCYPDANGRPVCGYQDRTVWGYRFVEYFNRNTTTEMFADLITKHASLARFTGAKTEAQKIYTYTSICR